MSPPPEKDKAISFAEAVRVSLIPGSNSIFDANIPPEWSTYPIAHGGIQQALIFSTARTYFQTQHPSLNQPDTIVSHSQFLKPAQNGPARLVVTPLQFGSRVSVVQIAIQNQDPGLDTFKTCLLATVTQGNLSTEKGVTLETEKVLRRDKKDVPDRERDCELYIDDLGTQEFVPAVLKVTKYAVKKRREAGSIDGKERSVREFWYGLADGGGWDILSLGFLVDLCSPAPSEFADNHADFMQGVRYPTLTMATEIKRDPKGCKWLFMRIQAEEIRNGRFDTNYTVLNEDGELIVTSKHVSLVNSRMDSESIKSVYKL